MNHINIEITRHIKKDIARNSKTQNIYKFKSIPVFIYIYLFVETNTKTFTEVYIIKNPYTYT